MKKRCSKCNSIKLIDRFVKSSRNKTGYASVCLECRRKESNEYRVKYPDRVKSAYHRFREKHPDRIKQFSKNDYVKHKEARDDTRKRWKQSHPESNKLALKKWASKPENLSLKRKLSNAWNHAHPEAMRLAAKRWRDTHREGKWESNHRRAMLKLGITGSHTHQEWIDLCNRYGNICLRCKQRNKLTRDHIIPITHPNCTDNIENIQPLCGPCNTSKGNKTIDYRQ